MYCRRKQLHRVVDALHAHKKAMVKEHVACTKGRLMAHFPKGYMPDLNPDELVWSYAKCAGATRRPLQKGRKPQGRVHKQLCQIGDNPKWVSEIGWHEGMPL